MFRIYDFIIGKRVKQNDTPRHIVLVLDKGEFKESKLDIFLKWCSEFNIDKVNIYISIKKRNGKSKGKEIKKRSKTKNGVRYDISVGFGGRREFIHILRKLGEKVKKGKIDPKDVDRKNIEKNLVFNGEPDLLIKTGNEHLSDFMLWQSVYSEIYFADFNWKNLRKRDFLRALREFQNRERRYGK